jgi:hypothetical protein
MHYGDKEFRLLWIYLSFHNFGIAKDSVCNLRKPLSGMG